MKRGKGEEKMMGPMFPRLHVNDKEKGGPRAPPRNKMALYEQLSIPSQRFNNTTKSGPPSSSQGSGHERVAYFPVQRPSSIHLADKPSGHSSDPSTLMQQFEMDKRTEEDDFAVPVFVNSKPGQFNGTSCHNLDIEKLSPSGPVFSGYPNRDLKGVTNLTTRQEHNCQNEENPKHITDSSEHKTTSNSPSKECRVDPQAGCTIIPEPVTRIVDDNSYPMKEFASEEQIITNNLIDDTESREDRTCKSLQTGVVDRGDDLSDTSIIESISGTDISPDDVVGIIGLKRFWKARRAIVNQQRVFAVQVFELHRLLKVQKLIAGSPDSMQEDAAYLGKPLKSSSVKGLPLECKSQNVPKRKNDSEKPNFRMEYSAENTVGKASLSSVQNGSQHSSQRPFSGNPPATPVTNDSSAGPWGFQQPSGHQWLIPVMSPSEGLVYKPFPGPDFASPTCGGCGPPGSAPIMGNFFPTTYGVPAPHLHYQGMGVPFVPPTSHGYFPPYGMPAMNPPNSSSAVEESNQFTSPDLQRQLSGGVPDFNIQHQDSSNVQIEKNGAVLHVLKFHAYRDNELQASTASSPSERAHRAATTEGRSMLSLFPTSPEDPDCTPQACVPNHQARVIKVVPHNARTATESAARIFQSIQEERKQHDSGFTYL